MSLRIRADAALNSLPLFHDEERLLDCHEAGHTLRCQLTALDKLGCAFGTFEVRNSVLATAAMDRLKQVADTLSHRLTYLLEPISPIEIDHDQCVVQLRSNPPQKDETGTSYYELHVAAGGLLSLCRYVKEPGTPRRAIPAHVTREVFLRLVADFAAAG